VWEAVFILDGLLQNRSDIQPDKIWTPGTRRFADINRKSGHSPGIAGADAPTPR